MATVTRDEIKDALDQRAHLSRADLAAHVERLFPGGAAVELADLCDAFAMPMHPYRYYFAIVCSRLAGVSSAGSMMRSKKKLETIAADLRNPPAPPP